MVWPAAVVLVMTLPGTMLLPNVAPLVPVRDNALLVAAVAALRGAFRVADLAVLEPSRPHRLRGAGAGPLEPGAAGAVLAPGADPPHLLLELLLIARYSLYSQVRTAAAGGRATAEEHARQIVSVERFLHIDIERWANHAVVKADWLEAFFNFYYSSFHFVVPLTILGLLYARRPADYRWARSSLGFATVLALVGFWLYPLAPPRLVPGLGYIDTIHGPQDLASPEYGALTALTNQYAAMPSLHFGWSLWCGLVVVLIAPKLWMKLLGLLHPLFTVCAIVATANHWVLDAVGGAAVVGAGFGLTYVLAGPRKLLRPVPQPPSGPSVPQPSSAPQLPAPGLPLPGAGMSDGREVPAGSAGSGSGTPK